jgi:hypothetical protein
MGCVIKQVNSETSRHFSLDMLFRVFCPFLERYCYNNGTSRHFDRDRLFWVLFFILLTLLLQ